MKVDDIVTYWQKIGIETPHDKSLEDILTEVSVVQQHEMPVNLMHLCMQTVPADPSGRINVGDLTETLEGSILTDGKSQNGTVSVNRITHVCLILCCSSPPSGSEVL